MCPSSRQRETRSVRKITSSEGSHYPADVSCCESIHCFPNLSKAGEKKNPPQLQGSVGIRQVVTRHRWKDLGAEASLLRIQAACLFPSAQRWNLFLWQSRYGLRQHSPRCLLSPLHPEPTVTHLRGQSHQSWQAVKGTHGGPRVAPTSTHHKTSPICPRFKCFPHSTVPF